MIDPDDEGWEARMAARATERAEWQNLRDQSAGLSDWNAHMAQQRRMAAVRVAPMTLAAALVVLNPDRPRIGCACNAEYSACCQRDGEQALRLQRAAHVAVKLLADLAVLRAKRGCRR